MGGREMDLCLTRNLPEIQRRRISSSLPRAMMAGLAGDKGWAERQEAGKDTQSVIADSLFMDPEPGDLRLQPGSPAAQIGFESWDISDVGRRPFPADSK